jgi:hypothetical protein
MISTILLKQQLPIGSEESASPFRRGYARMLSEERKVRNSGLEWIGVGANAPGLRNNNIVEGLMLVAEACQSDSKDHGGGCDVRDGD